MKKLLSIFSVFFFFIAVVVMEAEVKAESDNHYPICEFGNHPLDVNRQLAEGEFFFTLQRDIKTPVRTLGKGAYSKLCVLSKGTEIVLKKVSEERYEFSWVRACGNEIYTTAFPNKKERLYITKLPPDEVVVQQPQSQPPQSLESLAPMHVVPPPVDNKEYCLTWDSTATTIGSFGVVAGIKLITASNLLAGIPAVIAGSYLLYKGANNKFSDYKTDPGCKVLGGIIGGMSAGLINFGGAAIAADGTGGASVAPIGGGAIP